MIYYVAKQTLTKKCTMIHDGYYFDLIKASNNDEDNTVKSKPNFPYTSFQIYELTSPNKYGGASPIQDDSGIDVIH